MEGPTQKSLPFPYCPSSLRHLFHWKVFRFMALLIIAAIVYSSIWGYQDSEYEHWHVVIAHEPRYDLLGSFVLPTLLLLGVAQHHNWTLQIFPFAGTLQHDKLQHLVELKGNVSKDWGSGFQDVSHRTDYNPMELNDKSYEEIGFFPVVSKTRKIRENYPWIRCDQIPLPGKELHQVCKRNKQRSNRAVNECYILLPDDPFLIIDHMSALGGIDHFFTLQFSKQLRNQFLLKNGHRVQKYETIVNHNYTSTTNEQANTTMLQNVFNVAIHIRRGDILDPDRWIEQQVFANVAKYICETNNINTNKTILTNIHVFSSGVNRDGDWSIMERLAQPSKDGSNTIQPPICSNVFIHLDELEFDNWAYFVSADALVISPSTFSYVPALIRRDNVYFPRKFWHPVLSSFTIFNDKNGRILPKR